MATNDSEQPIGSSNNRANEPKICKSCGAKATRRYYGVFCCETCKKFFHVTVQNDRRYFCIGNKSCDVSKNTKKKCQYCRFQKCLKVGMYRKGATKQIKRLKLNEENRKKYREENQLEPEFYSEVNAEFLTDVSTASDLAFGLKEFTIVQFPLECDHHKTIKKLLRPTIDRAYEFLSYIFLVNEMKFEDYDPFTRSRLLPVVYMRSILLFPRHENPIQSNESIISQSGLTYLINSFQTFSSQLQEVKFKPRELILLPLYCAIKDNEDDCDVNQSPIVNNIRERVRSLLPEHWFLPEQQVLLNSILQLSSKHEENLSKLKIDSSNSQHVYKILISIFDISVW